MSEWLYNIQLIIPSTAEGLNECLDIVNDISIKFDLDFEKTFALHTVLVEAVENAIIHGNRGIRDYTVRLDIRINFYQIFLEVEDQGNGFDINLIPSPVSAGNICKEAGRGIFFIKNLSDSFWNIGKGNIVRILINR
jgi:serine/threonine-protein kinase RsbW